jgi:hypothetical protein
MELHGVIYTYIDIKYVRMGWTGGYEDYVESLKHGWKIIHGRRKWEVKARADHKK